MKHPNIKLTEDGGEKPYTYGEDIEGIADLRIQMKKADKESALQEEETDYEFISEEELERELSNEEKKGEQNEQEKHEQKTEGTDGCVDGAGTDIHDQPDSSG
jgi:hypothetical protein